MNHYEEAQGITIAHRLLAREFRLKELSSEKAPNVLLSHEQEMKEFAKTEFQQWRDTVNCTEPEREKIFMLARIRHLIEAARRYVKWEKNGQITEEPFEEDKLAPEEEESIEDYFQEDCLNAWVYWGSFFPQEAKEMILEKIRKGDDIDVH